MIDIQIGIIKFFFFIFLPSGYSCRNKEKCPGYLDDVADACCTWNVLTFAMFDGGGGAGLTGALTAFQSEQPTCYKNKFYLIAKKRVIASPFDDRVLCDMG
jgi:hypothetical protein